MTSLPTLDVSPKPVAVSRLNATGWSTDGHDEPKDEDIEHPIIVGVGGAVELELGDGSLHPGANLMVEWDAIENWLEFELEASILSANGCVEVPLGLLVKKPFRLTRRFEFMISVGRVDDGLTADAHQRYRRLDSDPRLSFEDGDLAILSDLVKLEVELVQLGTHLALDLGGDLLSLALVRILERVDAVHQLIGRASHLEVQAADRLTPSRCDVDLPVRARRVLTQHLCLPCSVGALPSRAAMNIIRVLPFSLFAVSCASQPATTAPAVTPVAATATTAATVTPAAQSPQAAPPATPVAIAIAAGQQVVLKAAAKGVQIYACKPKESAPSVYEWTLKAPEAELFDDKGQKIGKHYGGPTWESSDGSKVVGKLRSKVDAPEATAIPWLLLDVKSSEGAGVLSKVKNIQRVATAGGKAPAIGCDAAHAGAETRVEYSATYYMYGP